MSDGQRRLAAIVAADVAGYSRLMGADEEGTVAALGIIRRDIIDPKLAQYHGRIANTAGDSLLIEFSSAVDALRCAVELQRDIAGHNLDIPAESRLMFRIGLNVGDVIGQGDDLLGDGVNVAARLEALAEPGGICLSRAARDQVRDRMEIELEDMGEIEVKNIARPVHVFKVAMTMPAPSTITPADPNKMAFRLPDKPSIAVLPLDNMSGDPTQDYIGDGLTENIIAVLATSPDLMVIARNSSFTYKGKATQVQQVAEELGVRYVLEGSVQRAGDKLRVTVQLVDAIDGHHLWAERYDRNLEDLFELQDDIAERITSEMQIKLTRDEQARAWRGAAADPEMYRLSNLGRSEMLKHDVAGFKNGERLFTEAFERDPDNAFANYLMGGLFHHKVWVWASDDRPGDLAKARTFAVKSISIDENFAPYHYLLATISLLETDHEAALAQANRAITLAPADGMVIQGAGFIHTACAEPARGVELLKLGMRYEPIYPDWLPGNLSMALLMLGRTEEVKPLANGVLASQVDDVRAHYLARNHLTVAAVFEGDLDTARRWAHEQMELFPTASVSFVRSAYYYLKDQVYLERYIAALQEAGWPE